MVRFEPFPDRHTIASSSISGMDWFTGRIKLTIGQDSINLWKDGGGCVLSYIQFHHFLSRLGISPVEFGSNNNFRW